jgi:Winged helix DNA-binding domain
MLPRDIAHQRLINQQIAAPSHKKPCDLVAALGAIQAQDFLGALWAIGLRLPQATEAEIKQAIADRAIIRTWPMRGTLHFVAAADVRWMLELLAPRIIAGSAGRYRQLELDTAVFLRGEKVFIKALQGGVALTRDQMYELLERSRISSAGQRGIHILSRLAQEGLICFGAHAGKQPTFVLLDEWAPGARKLAPGEALAELALRYFTSRGPAMLQDFAWWAGLKVADAKAALEMVSSRLTQETIGGSAYWMSPDKRVAPDLSAQVNLLPSFDEFLLAYKDRSASLDPRDAPKIVPGKGGMYLPTIVTKGRVEGTWRRMFKKNMVVINTNFFTSPKTRKTRAFADEAERYSRFLGVPLESKA